MTEGCERCGSALVDDGATSWPYCPRCDWCPDCGITHPAHADTREDASWRVWDG